MEKMKKPFDLLSAYPMSAICVAAIWVLCFCTPPRTPLDDVPLMDKWTHLVMYGGTCSVMWAETLRSRRPFPGMRRMLVYVWLCPVLMSGLIEILQAYCTGGRRSGDWLDFLANGIGATLGFAVGCVAFRLMRRRK